ncbi:HAD family hydrolase [Bradyrhizobium sp. ISRA443]|uniref:HAD family hydrolase n=1 Tax=unclassified Bradyrhizobium TaxID=2631580 RepID=UPI00247A4F5A|nr:MULTISPECIES: HAD family hydrolase [unclassified Bradyrhizobium]WGR92725.1 HAD family hydrolase [Bradyrhizobium sp. ISRA435]WGR97177.1 HAD family hydrolase [Bradyrhizobium sp. ISRA436]WGS04065.1 HAD family hydrolase [Bradyrhizobium sp. ISRA437]WGS10948.1 HAD family hydrolase [Bradyrhizobium sp. ISRA443]
MNQALAAIRTAGMRDVIASARALIFDVDGTLAETEEVHRRAFNEAFAEAGLDWSWDKVTYGRLLRVAGGKERIRAFDQRNATPSLTFADIADLHRIKTARYAALIAAGGCPLRPGVRAWLRSARSRGQRLAIATTTSHGNIDALLSVALGLDWADLFETIVAGDDVPRKKPAPDVYVEVLARLGLGPADCIAIEDSGNGLMAASRAGIPAVITRSAYFGEDDFTGALLVVGDLSEIDY